MNIDEYLNNLQNDLNQRLSEFGVETSRQASPQLTSPEGGGTDDAMETESKFCQECGNKVANDANFCPNCGYRFNADESEAETTPEGSETCQNQERPTGKRKFRVSFACRPIVFRCSRPTRN